MLMIIGCAGCIAFCIGQYIRERGERKHGMDNVFVVYIPR